MDIHNSIQQKTNTKVLNISNQIVQFLNILNMGRYELEEAIVAEAESNPLLEVDIKDDGINWEEYFKKKNSTMILIKMNQCMQITLTMTLKI